MKKIIFNTLSMTLIVVLAACGNDEDNSEANGEENESAINYPEQPIEMLVPFGAGGNTDLVARVVSAAADEYIDQPINVVNNAGGGGVIALTEITNSPADGYTIAMATNGPLTIKPHTDAQYSYDDFKPIIQVTEVPIGLAVPIDAPYDSFEEWQDWVEENPGQFEYGTPGAGLSQHITMESINNELDIDVTHVPYDSGSEAITATVGGHTDGTFTQITELNSFVNNEELKILFIASEERNDLLPDVPTLNELGVDVTGAAWTGVIASKDTPDEIIEYLHDSFQEVLEDEEFIEQLNDLDAEVVYLNSEEWANKIAEEHEINGEIIQNIGLSD